MRDIEGLIKSWEFEADNDGNPPKITEEERCALALKLLEIQNEQRGVRPLPIIGVSEEQFIRIEYLNRRVGVIHNFIRETLMESGYVNDKAVQDYVNKVGKNRKQGL